MGLPLTLQQHINRIRATLRTLENTASISADNSDFVELKRILLDHIGQLERGGDASDSDL